LSSCLLIAIILLFASGIFFYFGTDSLMIKKYATEVPTTIAKIKGIRIYEWKVKSEVIDGNEIQVPETIPGTTVEIGGKAPTK
jgi:hypothetical protein